MAAKQTSPPVPGNPGNAVKGQNRMNRAETSAQGCPSRAAKRRGNAQEVVEPLPTVTVAQVVAAQLRLQATALIRQAEQLEATVPRQPKRKRPEKSFKQIAKEMGRNV